MKALVVDDDEVIVRLVSMHLEKQGFTVVTAPNGEDALQAVLEHHPHLIVMDINMPKMDGLQTLERIRRNPATARIPVIMLTARDNPAEVYQGWETGADWYLTKPLKPADLQWAVEHVFSVSEEKPILAPLKPPEE